MYKKTKVILLSIVLVIILLMCTILVKLINDGFEFSVYCTENYLEIQLENFLSEESGQDYANQITSIGKREYSDNTIMFYEVNNGENIIVGYKNNGKFGKYNVFSLKKIVKSDNFIAMIDIYDNNRRKYIILSSVDKNNFSSVNIVNKATNKILDQIDLENISEEVFSVEELNNKSVILEYIPKSDLELKLELNKKSGN